MQISIVSPYSIHLFTNKCWYTRALGWTTWEQVKYRLGHLKRNGGKKQNKRVNEETDSRRVEEEEE